MKKLLGILALVLLFNVAALAEDKTFYGAWWQSAPRAQLFAGQLEVVLSDVGNVAGVGNVTVYAWDDTGAMFEWTYLWTAAANGKTITFTTLGVTPGTVVWKGKFNRITGNLTGSWKNNLAKGKFQATAKLF
jgi:hypothetical protein